MKQAMLVALVALALGCSGELHVKTRKATQPQAETSSAQDPEPVEDVVEADNVETIVFPEHDDGGMAAYRECIDHERSKWWGKSKFNFCASQLCVARGGMPEYSRGAYVGCGAGLWRQSNSTGKDLCFYIGTTVAEYDHCLSVLAVIERQKIGDVEVNGE